MPVTVCKTREEAQALYVGKCQSGAFMPAIFVEQMPGKWSRGPGWQRRIEGMVLNMNQAPRYFPVEVYAFPLPEEGRRAYLFVGLYPVNAAH